MSGEIVWSIRDSMGVEPEGIGEVPNKYLSLVFIKNVEFGERNKGEGDILVQVSMSKKSARCFPRAR